MVVYVCECDGDGCSYGVVSPIAMWCFSLHPLAQILYLHSSNLHCVAWLFLVVVVVVDVCYCGSGSYSYGDIYDYNLHCWVVVFQSLYTGKSGHLSAFQLAVILILHCPYLGALKAC